MPRTAGIHKGSTANYRAPQIDEDKFHELFDILHDGCFEGNWTATARCLQVSINTAKNWSRKAPNRYWEIVNLHSAIRDVYKYMQASKHKRIRHRAEKVRGQLGRAGLHGFLEILDQSVTQHAEACIHLMSTIAWTIHREMATDELFLAANSGGFSKRILRQAAGELGLSKETKGYGPDKITYYGIPKP